MSSRLVSSLNLFSSEADCAAAGTVENKTNKQTNSKTWYGKDGSREPGKSRFTELPYPGLPGRPRGWDCRQFYHSAFRKQVQMLNVQYSPAHCADHPRGLW